MLAENWEEACSQVLGRDEQDGRDDFNHARNYFFETKDASGARDLYPRAFTAEKAILSSLIKQNVPQEKWDYLQALQTIPRNMKTMYVHAYQSRVWNEMVSIRHEKFGMKVLVGDVVRIPKPLVDEEQEEEMIKERRGLGHVRVIENDEEASQYTPFDILLPLPGHSVQYPPLMIDDYTKFMALDGFAPTRMARKIPDINLPGFYRNVYKKAGDVKARFENYEISSGPDIAQFITSDLELMNKKPESEKDRIEIDGEAPSTTSQEKGNSRS